jgi:hypothetical protein
MNLLNLILIVLIITIEPFISLVFNNGLVFIKPENLTKTELIEKFKELSSSKSLDNLKNIKSDDKKDNDRITLKYLLKTYYLRLSAFVFKFHSILTKLTLFTIIIRYLRKMNMMKFIWSIINSVLLSTFGIILSDVYGFGDIFEYFKGYWMEYVNFIHGTKFYKILVKIFNELKESDVKSDKVSNPEINEVFNKSEKVSDIVENKESYDFPSSYQQIETEKIRNVKSNWGNFENTKIKADSEINDSPFYKNKDLLILGLSIITLGLIYIYWDSIIESFKNVKPDLGKDEDGSNVTNSPVISTHQEEYQKYFKELETNEELYDLDVIRSQNNSKTVEYIDVENTKWEDSPITPKASSSKLPKTSGVMLPISKN